MIFSRTMRESDYPELASEGALIQEVHSAIKMWNDKQHKHRLWEYALALKALETVFPKYCRDADSPWQVRLVTSDHGCVAGYMSPLLLWLGCNVQMYECWSFGSEEGFMLEQMRRVAEKRGVLAGYYEMRHRPLCELVEEDKGVDAAFCISTLEHIGEYQKAFRDLLSTVKKGGLVFLTTDFAEDEEDHYMYNYLRAGKMFNRTTYEELREIGEEMGFDLLNGADWNWYPECRLVNDYGFASLAMRRME